MIPIQNNVETNNSINSNNKSKLKAPEIHQRRKIDELLDDIPLIFEKPQPKSKGSITTKLLMKSKPKQSGSLIRSKKSMASSTTNVASSRVTIRGEIARKVSFNAHEIRDGKRVPTLPPSPSSSIDSEDDDDEIAKLLLPKSNPSRTGTTSYFSSNMISHLVSINKKLHLS